MSEKEKQMYNVLVCIHNLYATQDYNNENVNYPVVTGVEQEENFNEIVKLMNKGVVPMLSGEGHTVSVTGIYRDIDNPMEYTMTVYDSNQPNEEKHLKIVKEKTHFSILSLEHNLKNNYLYSIIDTDGVFNQKGKKISVVFSVSKEFLDEIEE